MDPEEVDVPLQVGEELPDGPLHVPRLGYVAADDEDIRPRLQGDLGRVGSDAARHRDEQPPLLERLPDLADVFPPRLAAPPLQIDGPVEDDAVGEPLQGLQLGHRVLDLHEVDEGVDAQPPGLVDEVVEGRGGGGPRGADRVGGLLEGDVNLDLAHVHRLQVGDDEAVPGDLPQLPDDPDAVPLDEGGPRFQDDAVAPRDGRDHPLDRLDVGHIQGDLEVGRPPQPRRPEAHQGVAGPILVVHDLLQRRIPLQSPAQGQLRRAVVVMVDPPPARDTSALQY